MLDIKIAEISSAAGELNDGVVRGSINRSILLGSYTNLLVATSVSAIRRDTTSGIVTYTDVSADATSNVDNQFLPWGTDTAFSGDDEIWVVNGDKNINEIYVQITTPGVWTGTGLQVLESVDGETLTPVQNLVDTSNGLRNAAGIYKISFSANTANRKTVSPQFEQTKKKYVVIRPNGLTAKTTSPKLKMMWLVDNENNNTWANALTETNKTLTDSDFSTYLSTTIFPTIGNESRFAFSGLSIGVYDAVYRGISNNFTVAVEYLASDNTWKTLPDYVDASANFTNASTTYSSTPTYFYRKWSIPSDWAIKTLTHAPETAAITAYWIRRRITAVSTFGPLPIYLYRRRSLTFGSGFANGIYHKSAESYSYLTYDIGSPSTTNTVISFVNAITGQTRSVTIPANSTNSGSLTSGRLDFASTLSIGAGEMLLISYVSGTGTMRDCEFHLN